MKRILITGANSYIGTSFEKYMSQWPEKYQVDAVDMIDGTWREKDFSGYDTVFHVAGLAHSDTGRASEERKTFYYKINRDLAFETAKKAKTDGVKQFVFMSSAIVYGGSAPLGKERIVDKDTPVSPANFYGDSKVQAENSIIPLNDDKFKVVVLRPPMIYGLGSKGNYPILSKLACRLLVFPAVKNKRSMLYVDNLSEFVRLMIENGEEGIFWPQNAEYANTAELVRMIATAHGKKIHIVRGLGWVLRLLRHCTGLVDKAFGSFCYAQDMSAYPVDYQVCTWKESIERTEGM